MSLLLFWVMKKKINSGTQITYILREFIIIFSNNSVDIFLGGKKKIQNQELFKPQFLRYWLLFYIRALFTPPI